MRETTLMVVEDNNDLRKLWCAWLESLGYRGECFASAEAALAAPAAAERAEMLITEFVLPGMNGLELLWRLRALRPELPTLIITAAHGDSLVAALGQDPLTALLFKPAPLTEIEAQLARLMCTAHSQRINDYVRCPAKSTPSSRNG